MPKVTPQYRAERRAHIMAAARRCFIRDGFHAASMQDLVQEAGMSSKEVYRYFPSKDAVIEAIAAENLEQVVGVIQQSVDNGASPQTAIATVLEFVTVRHGEDGFAAIALLVWSEALRNPTGRAPAQRHRHRLRQVERRCAPQPKDAVDLAEETPDDNGQLDPTALADLLLCLLPGYLMRLAVGGPEAVENIPSAIEMVLVVPTRSPAPA